LVFAKISGRPFIVRAREAIGARVKRVSRG
jgi:hypothetical protein